jgi:hypothetical protein
MAGVALQPDVVSVVPGSTGTCTVRVRNTGVVVDAFSVTVLGDAASWTTAAPAQLSLFPGAEGTIDVIFAPPRTSSLPAGPLPFAVRVVASQDPENSVVEEGTVTVGPFREFNAKITPRTSEGKKSARHEVIVDNRGNTAIEVELAAGDPDEQLAFDVRPRTLTVERGETARAAVKVAAKKSFAKGSDRRRPFNVTVTAGPGDPPVLLDATLVQKAGMPSFIVPLIAGAVALALIVAVVPGILKGKDKSGTIKLANESAVPTTVADDGSAEAAAAADAAAKAAAESEAAAAAEKAANGKDEGGATVTTAPVSSAPAGGGAAATGAATATPTDDAPPPPGDSTAVTAAPAPVASTTTTTAKPVAGSTTTTAPQPVVMYDSYRQQNAGEAHYHSVPVGGTVGQTFKATAPFLTEAWLNLYGGTVQMNIRKSGPGGAIVGSSPALTVVQYGLTKYTFPTPIALTVGQIYYLEGVAGGQTLYSWYSNTNDYVDGDGFINGAAHGHDMNAHVVGRSS